MESLKAYFAMVEAMKSTSLMSSDFSQNGFMHPRI